MRFARAPVSICSVLMAPFPREMILRPNSAAKSKYYHGDFFTAWRLVKSCKQDENALLKHKFAGIARIYM